MKLTWPLSGTVVLRLIRPEDAPSFCEAQLRSREQLRPWEPQRSDEWYDPDYQAPRIEALLARDNTFFWVLADGDRVIGTATLSNVVMGPWCSGDLGYWVDIDQVGRGLASAAVAAVCELADSELKLHRIAASTGKDNTPSQRVLAINGFKQYGTAPDYLHIDGAWRTCHLYQRILNTRAPGE